MIATLAFYLKFNTPTTPNNISIDYQLSWIHIYIRID